MNPKSHEEIAREITVIVHTMMKDAKLAKQVAESLIHRYFKNITERENYIEDVYAFVIEMVRNEMIKNEKKSFIRNEKRDFLKELGFSVANNPGNNNMTLLFKSSDYSADEILQILTFLTTIYESITGDQLIIQSAGTFQTEPILIPETV